MTKLFLKIILILLPVIILTITFELLARTIPTSYSIKDNYLENKREKIKILVLGSSSSNVGINPQYFGSEGFNIANSSQDSYYDYNVLLRYLHKCNNTKIVIIPVSYLTLFYRGIAYGAEPWRADYYSFYLNIPKPNKSKFDLTLYSALAVWDGPINVIKNVIKHSDLKINEYGYQYPEKPKSNIKNINDAIWKEPIIRHHKNMDSNFFNSNLALLDKIAKECVRKNIQIVFITTPVYKTYSDQVSKSYYDVMTETIKNISIKYSANSYNYFYDNRFDINDFTDSDHLNEEGAKKFSIILKNEVIDKLM